MNKSLIKAGKFLRIIDDNNVLSITNIGCLVVLIKVAVNPNPSIVDMGSLLIVLANYYGKAHLNKSKVKIADENKQAITDMESKLKIIQDKTAGLSAAIGLRNPIIK